MAKTEKPKKTDLASIIGRIVKLVIGLFTKNKTK